MIKVENVTKKYGSHTAIDNISFEIKEGEIVGFLGPNGAGKTTTMSIITGYIEPNSGHVEISGYNVSKKARKAKREIGYMPETTPLYNELTPKEFINYMAELKSVPRKERKAEKIPFLPGQELMQEKNGKERLRKKPGLKPRGIQSLLRSGNKKKNVRKDRKRKKGADPRKVRKESTRSFSESSEKFFRFPEK